MPRYVFFFAKSLVLIVICSCFHVSSSSASLWTREDPVSFCQGEVVLSLRVSLMFSYGFISALFLFLLLILGFSENGVFLFFFLFWVGVGFLFTDIIVITAIRT